MREGDTVFQCIKNYRKIEKNLIDKNKSEISEKELESINQKRLPN